MRRAVQMCRALGVWPRHCLADRLGALPGMKEKLEAGIKIADVGCGCAWLLTSLTPFGGMLSARAASMALGGVITEHTGCHP